MYGTQQHPIQQQKAAERLRRSVSLTSAGEGKSQPTECNFRRPARSWSFLLRGSAGIPVLWNLDPKVALLEGETVHRLVDMTSKAIAEVRNRLGWTRMAVAGPSPVSFHFGLEVFDRRREVSEEIETLG